MISKALTRFQEKVLSIFMDKYGTDAGVLVLNEYENNNKTFGEALIFIKQKITNIPQPITKLNL